ncbi:cAMP-binding domain of CRP or a regulatory subunit of cAMP-dependent protein kinases [Sinomicrobium oceani]|uniref:cAMP-binding domain of CRP or a regulatory subunit of cAMP-dependent protein kinases n=1 Tax=Sinomicrobium oceani TaxID=1150368 RepID=A0A1K1MDN8_9FLAO|nr:response regulator [Sinomicrobium oceani]SFW21250.1 cAMP-binding domain of CRP or a regulatory subunit of cAMP-dependent protein kinases [Sinomicrobium oceani]
MKKILLIEDDPVLRENTAELLELSGYEMITAPNGKKGVVLASEAHPDIIVCDIMMPELDGYGVLETLSANPETRKIPFIFLSAKTERKEVRKGMDLGADDYLTKPFEEEELLSAIESRLAKVSLLKEKDLSRSAETGADDDEDEIRDIHELKNFFTDEGEYFTFEEGETIYTEGNHANYIYLIEKGMVKTHRIEELGKELITDISRDDDFFGYYSFTQNIPYEESATALRQTSLYGIRKDTFAEILKTNHKLAVELIEFLAGDLSGVKEKLLQMAYGSVRKKTANTILRFVEKLQHQSDREIRISRNDLASVAGIAPESFIRTLSELKKEGLIAIEGRNIRVLNVEGLEKMR